jgi:type IV pilus modification protein PilV
MKILTAARRDRRNLAAPGFSPAASRCVSRSGAGFSLIEILVALVIISVGVLGVTAMQTASINGQLMSRNLDTSFNVVSDAFDRMQMNAENITDYVKNNYSQPFTVTVDANSPNPPSSSERPSGLVAATDYDAIYHNMYDMKMSSGVLTVQLTVDSPVTGADTADAVLSWNYKGKQKKCSISTIIIKDKSVRN